MRMRFLSDTQLARFVPNFDYRSYTQFTALRMALFDLIVSVHERRKIYQQVVLVPLRKPTAGSEPSNFPRRFRCYVKVQIGINYQNVARK